jgi:hypothetical protein
MPALTDYCMEKYNRVELRWFTSLMVSDDFALIIIKGFSETKNAMILLSAGEHLWVKGIGSNLIRFSKLSEAGYRVTLFSVWRDSTCFLVKDLRVDARVTQAEAFRLVIKLGARPCKVVRSGFVDERGALDDFGDRELSYQDYVNEVKDKDLPMQINP